MKGTRLQRNFAPVALQGPCDIQLEYQRVLFEQESEHEGNVMMFQLHVAVVSANRMGD